MHSATDCTAAGRCGAGTAHGFYKCQLVGAAGEVLWWRTSCGEIGDVLRGTTRERTGAVHSRGYTQVVNQVEHAAGAGEEDAGGAVVVAIVIVVGVKEEFWRVVVDGRRGVQKGACAGAGLTRARV